MKSTRKTRIIRPQPRTIMGWLRTTVSIPKRSIHLSAVALVRTEIPRMGMVKSGNFWVGVLVGVILFYLYSTKMKKGPSS
jgi:hypothetical protein